MIVDICIIGGGINGLATANLAQQRGYSVIVIEKDKIGAGASTKTSKLVHGGLRYLEQFNFKLVRESLKQRNILLKKYPNLVKPLPFIFPVYSEGWKIQIGLKLYDFLAWDSALPWSSRVDCRKVSWLRQPKYAFQFYDALMDDAAILEELAKNVEVFENEKFIKHEQSKDSVAIETDKRIILSKFLIFTTGAWSNSVYGKEIVAPTKGVHIVIKEIDPVYASVLRSPIDNRVFFTIPFKGKTIIGTTDTPFSDPEKIKVEKEDIDYLLESFNYFSRDKISSILDSYVGLRPLVNDRSRDYAIHKNGRVLCVVGGKFTIHELMAEKVILGIGSVQ
jgi:glycerol-3-phosphate dehydrogenase